MRTPVGADATAATSGVMDEALLVLQLRRMRRWFGGVARPVGFVVALLSIPWIAAPWVLRLLAAGPSEAQLGPRWPFGSLLATLGLGLAAAGWYQAGQFWSGEHRLRRLPAWLLADRDPGRVSASVWGGAITFALALAAVPLAIAVPVGAAQAPSAWQWAEAAALALLCAAAGSAVGSAGFFVRNRLIWRCWAPLAALFVLGLAVAFWLRCETAQGGWGRPWEERPLRVVTAVALLTPAPVLYGVADPGWWGRFCHGALGFSLSAWHGGLSYSLGLLMVTIAGLGLSRAGMRRLQQEPETLEARRPATPVQEDSGRRSPGRGNPVWARELRTRLRDRTTASLILIAVLVVAAGAFAPLLLAAQSLASPLETAAVARQVFFWLTLVLFGLAVVAAPGLAAQAFTLERQSRGLELLIATPMRTRQILLGKLAGTAAFVAMLLSPSLPLFGLCALFRGVSGGQVTTIYVLLLATVILGAYLGVTASAMHNSSGAARMQAYCLTLLLAVPGGLLSTIVAVATPAAGSRRAAGVGELSSVILIFGGVLLWHLWRNASARLRYPAE